MRPPRAHRWLPAALALLLSACSQLPPLQGRTESAAIPATAETRLGAALQPLLPAPTPLKRIAYPWPCRRSPDSKSSGRRP